MEPSPYSSSVGPKQDFSTTPTKRDPKGKGKISATSSDLAKMKLLVARAQEEAPEKITRKVKKAEPGDYPKVTGARASIGPSSSSETTASQALKTSASSGESVSGGVPAVAASSSSTPAPDIRKEIQDVLKRWTELTIEGKKPIVFIDVDNEIKCGRSEFLNIKQITDPAKIAHHVMSMSPPLTAEEREKLIPILDKSKVGSAKLSVEIKHCMSQWNAIRKKLGYPRLYLTLDGSLHCCTQSQFVGLDKSKIAIDHPFKVAKHLIDKTLSQEDLKELQPFAKYLEGIKGEIIPDIDSDKRANVWVVDGKKIRHGSDQFLSVMDSLKYNE